MASLFDDSNDGKGVINVAVIGTGFSGSLFVNELQKRNYKNVKITAFEQSNKGDYGHWTQPLAGAALNINANGMGTLKQFDQDLYNKLSSIGNPRKKIKSNSIDKRVGTLIDIEDTIEEELSDCYGTIIRWGDANNITRNLVKPESIRWGSKVTSFEYIKESELFYILIEGERNKVGPFHFIVSADGRYSTIRQQSERIDGFDYKKTGIPVTYDNVYNFRLLVPDSIENDGQNGLFDDLELYYNIPDLSQKFKNTKAFQGLARAGIAKCLPSELYPEGSIYIFGNFSVEDDNFNDLGESYKSPEFLKALYTPVGGEVNMSSQGKWLVDTLISNSNRLHWSRFQHIEPKFSPNKITDKFELYENDFLPILYLGDCGHAFPPSLGQGATTSIEDAFVAANVFISEFKKIGETFCHKRYFFKNVIENFTKLRYDRIEMIKTLSIKAGRHINPPTEAFDRNDQLQIEIDDWTVENGPCCFREKIRQIWKGYPKKSHFLLKDVDNLI